MTSFIDIHDVYRNDDNYDWDDDDDDDDDDDEQLNIPLFVLFNSCTSGNQNQMFSYFVFILQNKIYFFVKIIRFCFSPRQESYFTTRMHSSRMRTGRSLTVFRGLLLPGGCTYLVGGEGVPAWSRGCTCLVGGRGVYLPGLGGCTWSEAGRWGVLAWSGGRVLGQVPPR